MMKAPRAIAVSTVRTREAIEGLKQGKGGAHRHLKAF